jgi:alkylhydroperoxidase family enzyme
MDELTQIEWESCALTPARDPEMERYVRGAMGMVPPLAPYFYGLPWAVRCVVAFDESQLILEHVDVELARLISLVVAQESSCRFCYAASRALLKLHGLGKARIQRIEQDLQTAELSARVRTALEFARLIARANPLPGEAERGRLRDQGYSPDAIGEIAFLAAINIFYNRMATLPALPTETIERIARSWLVTLLRPLLVRFVMPRRKGPISVDSIEPYEGPFAYLPKALAPLPLAATLARQLREAWEPTVLPRRTKAVIFAVVGRGLDCSLSQAEAVRVLAEEGMAADEVRRVLEHLASPTLDRVERVLAPYARETIWFRPAQVQRRTRAVQAELTPEQFLDAVAVVSLANAVCRMNVGFDHEG